MNQRLFISLGLHSAAIIAFQLALMQLISVVQWHHFAYMIISVAMLGFGAGGTVLALARERLLSRAAWLVPLLMSLSGLCMMLSFHLARLEMFRFDAYLLFTSPAQFAILAANYLIFFIPFFTGALAIGIIFIRFSGNIGKWYFANLLGSGLGGIFFLALSSAIFPWHLTSITGLLCVAAGLISLSSDKRNLQLTFIIIAITAACIMLVRPVSLQLSEYKDLSRTMNLPEARVIYREPGIHGLIEVVESPALRYAPALSLAYSEPVPVKSMMFLNGDAYGVIPEFIPEHPSHILDHTTQALPYIANQRDNVLLLNAATGSSIAHAISRKAKQVHAVIPNNSITRLMRTRFDSLSGHLFFHDCLHVHRQEARTFIALSNDESYDMIALPLQESFGGTAGIHAMKEDYSLTLESFSLMWDKLTDSGVISVSTWLDYPSRASLKILATMVALAQKQRVENPELHIAAVRSWGTMTFIIKKTPLTESEIRRIREFCDLMFFDPVLLPGISHSERERYNMIGDTMLFSYMNEIMKGNTSFMNSYGFLIQPATDDKPYFSQYLKPGMIRHLAGMYGQGQLPFLELGYLIVMATFLQGAVLALLFILLPLLRLRTNKKRKAGTLIYFSALGIGYMFAEIIFIQRFVLYFGHPVYAISAVICTMMIASGAGSLVSEKIIARPINIKRIALIVSAILLLLIFTLTPLLRQTMVAPLPLKIAFGLLLICIPSFVKGMLFPLGIRYLTNYDPGQIPWAWGINGSTSVISTSLATLIAAGAGFRIVMGIAALCYLAAFLVFSMPGRFFSTQESP